MLINRIVYTAKQQTISNVRLHHGIVIFLVFLITFKNTAKSQFYNTQYGVETLKSITNGSWNSAFGFQALYADTTGFANTAIGHRALYANTNGSYNTAMGSDALYFTNSGYHNTGSGYRSLVYNVNGSSNAANGAYTLCFNTTGSSNTADGSWALYSNTEGCYNTALGHSADVLSNNLTNATAIGANAKVASSNTIQLGDNAVTKIYAGVGNTATLVAGGLQITGGAPAAGKVLTSDASGVATWQTLTGGVAGWSLTGNAGTVDGTHFIGTIDNVPFNIRVNNQKAGRIDKDKGNTFYGYQAGNQNTTGGYNIANGHQAMYNNTTGDGNIAIGYSSLNANNTGSYNTAIGYNANTASGSLTNATAIGAGAVVNASNKIRLGDESITIIEGKVMFTTSDGRFKTNINEEEVKGLAFIKKLRPVVYNFDTRKFQSFLTQNMPADVRQKYMDKDFSVSTAIRQSGFIAQEVEKAAQEVGYDFNGIHKPESANDNYSLAYSQFVVPLVKAVQELNEQKDKQVQQLQQQLQQQQQQIDELKKLIASNNNSVITKDELAKPITGNEVQVYPNPNNGVFNVVVPAGAQKMELIDMKGVLLKTIHVDSKTASHQLNLSGYAKGVYMLQVLVNEKIQTTKIVVQ